MHTIKQRLTQIRTTPGTVVYGVADRRDPSVAISQQYISKSAFPDGVYPQAIEIEVKAVAAA